MVHSRLSWHWRALILVLAALSGSVWAPRSVSPDVLQGSRAMPTPSPKPRADQTSWVEGLVFDARTKAPLAGVKITLEGGEDDLFETRSGADGRYRFGHVMPNATADRNYAWSASLPGYSGRSTYAYGNTDSQIDVPKAGLKFDIALARAGVVRGLVRDISGRPVGGASVLVYGVPFDQSEDARTDSQGRFEIRGLSIPPGKNSQLYALSVENPRLSLAYTQVLVPPRYTKSDEVNVRLTMKPRAVISGRLMFRGQPLQNGSVSIERQGDAVIEETQHAFLGKNGRYSIKVSAPARYKVLFQGDDVLPQQAQASVLPGRAVAFNREMKPFPYGSLAGRIVDLKGRGIRGADIELWTPNTSETMPVATTDAQGRFFVTKVAPFDAYNVGITLRSAQKRGGVRIRSVRVRSGRTTRVFARADTVAPRLRVLTRIPRVITAGLISFRVRASDNRGVEFAHLEVDGKWANDGKTDSVADFAPEKRAPPREAEGVLRWDARGVGNGEHLLKIAVGDAVGNETSRSFRVRVQGSPFKAPKLQRAKPSAGY